MLFRSRGFIVFSPRGVEHEDRLHWSQALVYSSYPGLCSCSLLCPTVPAYPSALCSLLSPCARRYRRSAGAVVDMSDVDKHTPNQQIPPRPSYSSILSGKPSSPIERANFTPMTDATLTDSPASTVDSLPTVTEDSFVLSPPKDILLYEVSEELYHGYSYDLSIPHGTLRESIIPEQSHQTQASSPFPLSKPSKFNPEALPFVPSSAEPPLPLPLSPHASSSSVQNVHPLQVLNPLPPHLLAPSLVLFSNGPGHTTP